MRRPLFNASIALFVSLCTAACGGGSDTSPSAGGSVAPTALLISAMAPAQGPAGIVVTLAGVGFSTVPGENAVTLNGMPCTVDAASATQLRVIIPPRAGSGTLHVTVSSQSADSTTFTYQPSSVVVSTLAGSELGYFDDVGTAARFDGPTGLALDAAGFLYVGDSANNRIRLVSPTASVTTFAGSTNTAGDSDGAGLTQARFHNPDGLAIDASGTLYVADFNNNSIRRIDSSGVVTTFVTAGASGLSGPTGLAFDKSGDLYVADKGNHRILKITPSGAITTFAGGSPGHADGVGAAAQFQFPNGLAFCGDGDLFVADQNNNLIRRVKPDGTVSTYAGGIGGLAFVDGPSSTARFLAPRDLACDPQGKLFVVDTGNERIRMITPSGIVSTLAGSTVGFADGDGAAARFSLPQRIVIDAAGSLLISDAGNERIRKLIWQ